MGQSIESAITPVEHQVLGMMSEGVLFTLDALAELLCIPVDEVPSHMERLSIIADFPMERRGHQS